MEKFIVEDIPAVLWGEPSAKIYIYVHGKHGYKEYAEAFAKVAEKKGYQTLSFDLPKHGERKEAPEPCDIWQGIKDLEKIAAFTFGKWTEVNLFACSIGAFFALHAYRDKPFKKCLFQSPIIDMPWLIKQMMLWFNVSEARLEQEKRVATPFETLDWDYYQYVLQHPINKWPFPTEILYAGKDNLQLVEVMNNFATRFGSGLTVSPNSEHPFMGPEDADIVGEWLTKAI